MSHFNWPITKIKIKINTLKAHHTISFYVKVFGEPSPWLTQIAKKRKTLGKLYGIKV
jgi:hypothetical protein